MTKIKLYTLVFLLISLDSFSQDVLEQKCAEKIFVDSLRKNTFKKYEGKILIENKNEIRYGQRIIQLSYEDSSLLNIFKSGILYPILIGGDVYVKSQSELASLSENQKIIYNIIRNDSLSIHVEEIKQMKSLPHSKQFRFLLWHKGFSNPSLYFFELQNDTVKIEETLASFIAGSRLTILEFCSILL